MIRDAKFFAVFDALEPFASSQGECEAMTLAVLRSLQELTRKKGKGALT